MGDPPDATRRAAAGEGDAADPSAVVDRFRRAQADFYGGGPLAPLEALLAEGVVWHVPGASRIAGTHRGRREVIGYFRRRRELVEATLEIRGRGRLVVGELVVEVADGSASFAGARRAWSTVGAYRVEGGRVAEGWLFALDQDAFDALWGTG